MRTINASLDPQLLAKARRLDHLTLLLRQNLPPECDGHYHVANIKNRTVFIITDSPVWTTRLRQLAPVIVTLLTDNDVSNVQHVHVSSRIHYKTAPPPKPKLVKRKLSDASAELINQSSTYITDSRLKEALLKLASRNRKPKKP